MPVNIGPISIPNSDGCIIGLSGGSNMHGDHRALLNQVVKSFSGSLDPGVLDAIDKAGLDALGEMVGEALASQADAIFDRVEAETRRVRAELVERRLIEI